MKRFLISMFCFGFFAAPVASENLTVPLVNRDNQEVGTVKLSQKENNTRLEIDIQNLPPGTHAFHVHQTGACDAPKFTSAGDHFNPDEVQHGFLNKEGPHAGDLPNITISQDGTFQGSIVTDRVSLNRGDPQSVFQEGGTAIVIHKQPDDYLTNPAGDAGERIACGVIVPSNMQN